MTKHNPKKKFNSSSRAKKNTGGVIQYDDARGKLKAEMEKIMDAIDRNPDSFEAIITYGHGAIDRLGKIANEMIKIQGGFNAQVTAVADALSGLEGGLNGMDLGKFGEATQKLLKGLSRGGVSAENRKLVTELQQSLPRMLGEMIRLVDGLAGTEAGLKEVVKEAQKLAVERVKSSRELDTLLGTAKEVLRRYNEEYIPEAAKQFGETLDPEDQQYLKDILKRKEDFIDRTAILEGTRAAAIIAGQQVNQMLDTIEDQRKKIRDILDNSQNEWKAMLAAAGIAGTSVQAARGIGNEKNDNAPASSATSDPKVGKPVVKKPKGPQHH